MSKAEEQMSLEELGALNTQLSNDVAAIRVRQRKINDLISEKIAEEQAQAFLGGLPSETRDAVVHAVTAEVKRGQ